MAGSASLTGPNIGDLMSGLSSAIEHNRTKTVGDAAKAAKKAHSTVISRHSGGDMKLSGVGPRGAKVGVRYDIKHGGLAGASAVIRATGPLQLIDGDTSAHRVTSKYLKGTRASRSAFGPHVPNGARKGRGGRQGPVQRAVIKLGGDIGHRYSAHHPGTAGKDTWKKGRALATPAARKIIRMHTYRTIKSAAGAG